MRGLLSPHSKTNCQNYQPSLPSSPSNKGLYPQNLKDSCSTMGQSVLQQSQTQNKFYSFKKIKQDRIKQKNQQGKVIKQMVYRKNNLTHDRLKTLDDAKTIQSYNSPRSSVSVGKKPIIQQSVIIMRGRDLNQLTKQQRQSFGLDKDQPQTPYFKRRNTFNQQNNITTDYLKPISINPSLIKSIQSGMIFHFEIIKSKPQALFKLMQIKHEGILQIYSVQPFKSYSACSLVLYQPYFQSLSQNLIKIGNISFKQLLGYMIQIIKILSSLRNLSIYPQIQPTTVVISFSAIKIKLRDQSNSNPTQRQVLRQCGYYFSSLVKSINGCCSTPSSTRLRQGILGLSISKRIQFENLMSEFVRAQQFSLDEAYLKLQALNY